MKTNSRSSSAVFTLNCVLLLCSYSYQAFLLYPHSSRLGRASCAKDTLLTLKDKETDEKGPVTSQPLFDQLDEAFDYEGRVQGSQYKDFRCGFVAIVGAPNVGKSTLINALLQENLCIATSRPQTTRHAILGILTTNNTQVCLVDTPGVIEQPAYKLQEGMMDAVVGTFQQADVLLVVSDLFQTPIPNDDILQKIQKSKKPVIVVINKVDLVSVVEPERNLSVEQAVQHWRQQIPQALAVIPTAAIQGEPNPGVQLLRKLLTVGTDIPQAIRNLGRPIPGTFLPNVQFIDDQQVQELLPISPPLYDKEYLTDRSERFIASETVREALFLTLKKELPYCCEVQINKFKEEENNMIRIGGTVIVERDSQKIIVIGKNGQTIKAVGTSARKKLEDFFQSKVYLELRVKVDKDWRKKEDKLRQYGYIQR